MRFSPFALVLAVVFLGAGDKYEPARSSLMITQRPLEIINPIAADDSGKVKELKRTISITDTKSSILAKGTMNNLIKMNAKYNLQPAPELKKKKKRGFFKRLFK